MCSDGSIAAAWNIRFGAIRDSAMRGPLDDAREVGEIGWSGIYIGKVATR